MCGPWGVAHQRNGLNTCYLGWPLLLAFGPLWTASLPRRFRHPARDGTHATTPAKRLGLRRCSVNSELIDGSGFNVNDDMLNGERGGLQGEHRGRFHGHVAQKDLRPDHSSSRVRLGAPFYPPKPINSPRGDGRVGTNGTKSNGMNVG